MKEDVAKIMCQVFSWAYENGIDIELLSAHTYGGDRHPELVFRKNDKCIKIGFWSATDSTRMRDLLDYEWRKIAIELCVEPLVFEE